MDNEIKKLVESIHGIANPVIKYRIDHDILDKEVMIDDYISKHDPNIKYWIDNLKIREIHGSKDNTFENVMSKFLDYGFDQNDEDIKNLCEQILVSDIWDGEINFEQELFRTVSYPFLIRAGYFNHLVVQNFYKRRLKMLMNTIQKYHQEIALKQNKPARYEHEFVFIIDPTKEALPTIYDLYALAFSYRQDITNQETTNEIIDFILNQQFQEIPKKAYIFDPSNNRYYAAGNVYHACSNPSRKVLFFYLLSFFPKIQNSLLFQEELQSLKSYKRSDGLYQFDKSLLKEQKNTFHMYSGAHMGMNESRRTKSWLEIESSFWMMLILKNINTKELK